MLLAVLFCLAVVCWFCCCLPVLCLFAVSHGVLVFCLPGVVLSCAVAVSLLYLPFGVLAVVFFMLYLKIFFKKQTVSVCVRRVCVSGKTQLYLLMVPNGNRRHFHLVNIAGVWYILWFCGCFVPIVKCFIQL